MSRREALRRFGIAAAGTLFFFRPGSGHAAATRSGRMTGDDHCSYFCAYLYGYGTQAYERCRNDAKHKKGICYQFGPGSPACQGSTCPHGSFCVSNAFNFNSTSSKKAPVGYYCVPNQQA